MTSQTDGVLGRGCVGLPSRYLMELPWVLIDTEKGIDACKVSDTTTGEMLSCQRHEKLKLNRPQAVIKLQKVRHCISKTI